MLLRRTRKDALHQGQPLILELSNTLRDLFLLHSRNTSLLLLVQALLLLQAQDL